jgi:hypothetical protein
MAICRVTVKLRDADGNSYEAPLDEIMEEVEPDDETWNEDGTARVTEEVEVAEGVTLHRINQMTMVRPNGQRITWIFQHS